ncbi:hypothetical protein PYCCODRAFT_455810 [Trametes coccinea BRFM310]|uniref:Uncharacterized protein n=1 Tax=Trametes coccinea (strain BRFM310) TaxID=1353009 RepID=A0A1Y2IMH7_TRAC3|nr:hypothetical protein PYCCODRAFT_455810 [Trametes coccinea BRFM310]
MVGFIIGPRWRSDGRLVHLMDFLNAVGFRGQLTTSMTASTSGASRSPRALQGRRAFFTGTDGGPSILNGITIVGRDSPCTGRIYDELLPRSACRSMCCYVACCVTLGLFSSCSVPVACQLFQLALSL